MTEEVKKAEGAKDAKKVEKKKRNSNKLTSFMLTQQLKVTDENDPNYNDIPVSELWDLNVWDFKDFGNLREEAIAMMKKLGARKLVFEYGKFDLNLFVCISAFLLQHAGAKVEAIAAIVHDKDLNEHYDGSLVPKNPHVHMVVKFENGAGLTLGNTAKALGVKAEFIEKPKGGRYAFDNQLAYLIHAKDADKYQYDSSEVVSYGHKGFDYKVIAEQNKDRWERGRLVKEARKTALDMKGLKEALFQMVVVNEQFNSREDFVRRINLDRDYWLTYVRNKTDIDGWFDTIEEQRMLRLTDDMRNGRFSTKVLYITGGAGSGKTSFVAKPIIEGLLEKNPTWRVFYGGATNPVDNYRGEEIVFLDDLRGTAMSGSDWLKLLDPYTATPNSARYKNRTVTAQFIIITSVQPVYDFFYYVKGFGKVRDEPLGQFIRRLIAVIEVYNVDGERMVKVQGIEGGGKKAVIVGSGYDRKSLSVNHWVGDPVMGGDIKAVIPALVDALNQDHVYDVKATLEKHKNRLLSISDWNKMLEADKQRKEKAEGLARDERESFPF